MTTGSVYTNSGFSLHVGFESICVADPDSKTSRLKHESFSNARFKAF